MCGICGYLSPQKISSDNLWIMNNAMIHRGPDDGGIYEYEADCGYYIGLAQRRLSIIDLSEAGHQPMIDRSGNYIIVYNGETYNHEKLKNKLVKKGYSFKSKSDTEVLLYLYIEFGTKMLDMMDGMFAFAIYDKKKEELFLARDRAGEKPLYYYSHDHDFVFSSELKPIMLYPSYSKKICKKVIKQYLVHNTVLPPYTIFENTYKLEKGQYMIWKKGELNVVNYYDTVHSYQKLSECIEEDYNRCKKELKELLYASVEERLIADVPVGCFLSGGIDSTLVSAIAKDIKGELDTFCIGFEDTKLNEAIYAQQSAKYLGTHHHEMIMREEELMEMLDDVCIYYDEPFADSSQLATMLVSKYAKKYVTVALSGDGGDEFFAGYSKNDKLTQLLKYRKLFSPLRMIDTSLIQDIFSLIGKEELSSLLWMEDDSRLYQGEEYKRSKVADLIMCDSAIDYVNPIINAKGLNEIDNILQRRMLLDIMTYLPDEVLVKTDRASMKYSLELRTPLLDQQIMEYSFRIPIEYKYRNGEKKYILKDILYEYVPKEMMNRPKTGFGVPIKDWLLGPLYTKLMNYCKESALKIQGLFDSNGVKKLIMLTKTSDSYRYQATLWCFFVFQMWYQEYIDDLWK
ncbi:asparagine synthase (glutamine-hydrolyzing) [Butyrivibrio hungatei]|uniref:asparagine synthase (glutamine-hydrolyzing) n=1 Tax=Butyrivibrio hungatei TaxID=185008 RepID=A0A1D9NZ56_9FIRM|nr:asparagine synthase (glutamine-hydrolyzing) [Butyrivibrio hungatei]AOZ95501.1 asparagine synthase [Butyrivibrio hungatei]